MRTIKFRAFDDGKMIYENDILHIRNEDNLVLRLARFWCNIRNDCKIMQFTGLHDKNGKEIYEGDKTSYGVIMWNSEKALFAEHFYQEAIQEWSISSYPMSVDRMEIIGNIHENPEPL